MIDGKKSLVNSQQISVHFDCIDVPGHFCLSKWNYSSQMFEETTWYFLVQIIKVRLDLPF